jgi:lycopene cyclase domain-containing protein
MFEDKFLYLWINFLSIAFPLAFSFYSKAPFYKKWKYLWISTLIPAIIFILWDEYFTQLGVWGFNPRYLSGIYLGNLPLEEILFFICIPYACLFTYHALGYLVKKDWFAPYQNYITYSLVAGLLLMGGINIDKWYTGVTFISASAFLIALQVLTNPTYLSRFYFSYIFILIPFFIVNGILTGSWIEGEVVWYNNNENLGIRMGTIPVEDTFYGMLLLVMNVAIFEKLQAKESTSPQQA